VIDDVDRSLRALLGAHVGGADVAFDAPTPEWAAGVAGAKRPVLSLFLHAVDEDVAVRRADWDDVREADGRVVGRQPPLRRYRLSYLVSAWAGDPVEEHALLGRVLEVALVAEVVPLEHLHGRLAEQELPVVLEAAVRLPDVPAPPPHDLWSALGMPMRASLDLRVAAPLLPALSTDLAPAAERLDLGIAKVDAAGVGAGAGDGGAGPEPVGRVVKRWTGIRLTERP
jgi:hypothetical protein